MSETNNISHGPTGFIAVLPNTIIEIPLTSKETLNNISDILKSIG